MERAKEARFKAQKEAKEAKAPSIRPRKEKEANARQIDPTTKRKGESLLDRFVYLGDNHWLRRDGPTWATAARELDGFVEGAIADCGYQPLPPSPTNWMLVWEADSILSHATVRSTLTEREFVLQYMKETLHVHEIWNAAHWKHGRFLYDGKQILNRASFELVQGVGSTLPPCWDAFTSGLFVDQKERALGLWRELLKKAHGGGLNRGWFQPAGFALASEIGGVGKSRCFHYLARSLGAPFPAAAGGYIAGDILGSSHLLQEPVVEISDASVADRDVQSAQTRLLNLISNPIKEVRLMRKETKLVPLSPLVCVSLNRDNPNCTKIFHGLPASVKEKWIVIVCGNGTRSLREAGFDFDDLERTLPEMVGYLLSTTTPDEYLHEIVDGYRQRARFLVGHHFNLGLDLEWGPLGDLAPMWEDLQAVIAADFSPPKSGRYKVSGLRTLLLTLHDNSGDSTYRDMTVKKFGIELAKLQKAIPSVFQRKAVGNPEKGGWYEYFIV